jgi:hypothetical protein
MTKKGDSILRKAVILCEGRIIDSDSGELLTPGSSLYHKKKATKQAPSRLLRLLRITEKWTVFKITNVVQQHIGNKQHAS